MSEIQTDLFSQNLQESIPESKDNNNSNLVEEKEIMLSTQLSYLHIHALRSVGQYSIPEIAAKLHISRQTAHKACRWVRDNWEVLDTEEYLKDAERLIGARIQEYDKMLEEAKAGDPIIVEMKDKETGEILKTPLLVDGKVARKISKQSIREIMRDRREYEKMLLEIRGLFQKSQIILDKRNQTINNVSVCIGDVVKLADVMDESDKNTLLQICSKYGKSPI